MKFRFISKSYFYRDLKLMNFPFESDYETVKIVEKAQKELNKLTRQSSHWFDTPAIIVCENGRWFPVLIKKGRFIPDNRTFRMLRGVPGTFKLKLKLVETVDLYIWEQLPSKTY